MEKNTKEHFILNIMRAGFDRAAAALSMIIDKPVEVSKVELTFPRDMAGTIIAEEAGDLIVLTTRLMGDIHGKSYLIFNTEESNEIGAAIGQASSMLHEAALLEIDNIVSAAIISDLSNALAVEVYGDVPHLLKIHAGDLYQFFQNEAKEGDAQMFFTKATFLINHNEKIHPQFIWRLSTKIFNMIAV
jgi:chemotaxis protein CheY-P-specific phosphatase CheC